MTKLAWIALCGLLLAGCAGGNRDSASGGASTTPGPNNQEMRGSPDIAPGAEGDRRRPQGTPAPAPKY